MTRKRHPLLSNWIRNQRLNFVLPYIHGSILDLGCGRSPLLGKLPADCQYTGVDHNPRAIQRNIDTYPQHKFFQRDLDNQALDLNEKFDSIILAAVVEHLWHPSFLIQQLPACLNPGGIVLLTTPTRFGAWVHDLGARVNLFYYEATEDHKHIFTRQELFNLVAPFPFEIFAYRTFLFGGNQLLIARMQSEAI